MRGKKLIAASLGLFLLAPSMTHAAFDTSIERGVNFRNKPSTSSYVYRMIPKGEKIDVISKYNKYWLKVKVQDGTIGYISSNPKYTDYNGTSSSTSGSSSSVSASTKADRIISLARSLEDRVTYSYGKRNPSRMIFDCSSFVEYVFEENGVKLPWGTKYLKSEGKFVSKSNLRKGDLVLFATSGSSINHVGIYIGSGKVIHNKPSKGVAIDSITSGYWADKYKTARRVL
jgi:cell wall-associated NlpC family hydrolase